MPKAMKFVTAAFVFALLATPTGARARLVQREHHRVTFEFDNSICDGVVHSHTVFSVVENDMVRLSPSGFPMYSGVGRGTATFTDTATGRSVSFAFAGGSFHDFAATDNGDGTFTRDSQTTGTESEIYQGQTIGRASGRTVLRSVVDYNGTPGNGDDDTALRSWIIFSSGGSNGQPIDGCALLTA